MTDNQMLQAIASSIAVLRKEMRQGFDNVSLEFTKTNKTIDMLGKQLAELDDDAPTGEEFNKLEKRVSKLENKLTSIN